MVTENGPPQRVGDGNPGQMRPQPGDVLLEVAPGLLVAVMVQVAAPAEPDRAAAHDDPVIGCEPVVVDEVASVF
jgi:hypothetical protein